VWGKAQPVDIKKMGEVVETLKYMDIGQSGNHYSSVIIIQGYTIHDLDGALKVLYSLWNNKRHAAFTSL
jgi:hypothetical protein